MPVLDDRSHETPCLAKLVPQREMEVLLLPEGTEAAGLTETDVCPPNQILVFKHESLHPER